MLNAIFDFNGTMFFDETFQEKAWQQYMTEKLGRRITPEEFQTWVHGRNTGDTLEYFFGRPFTQQEADEEEEAEETIYRALCRQSPDYKLADGLVEFLDFLAAHKIPRTIATASCGSNVRFFFDTLGLDRWFDLDKVIYNDGTLPGKPAPDLYLKAAQRLCVAPETCVIFEDSGVQARPKSRMNDYVLGNKLINQYKDGNFTLDVNMLNPQKGQKVEVKVLSATGKSLFKQIQSITSPADTFIHF